MHDLFLFIITTGFIFTSSSFLVSSSPVSSLAANVRGSLHYLSTFTLTLALILGITGLLCYFGIFYPFSLFLFASVLFILSIFIHGKVHFSFPKLPKFDIREKSILTLLFVTYVWFLIVNLYQAPYVWDVLSYHLPPVVEWVNAHGFVNIEFPNERSQIFPMNFELLLAYVCVFFKHDLALRYVEIFIGFHIPLIVYGILENFFSHYLSRFIRILLSVSAFMTPAFLIQLNASRNDLTANVMALLVLYFSSLSWKQKTFYPFVFSCLAAAIALGTKTTTLLVLPVIFAVFLFAMMKDFGFKNILKRASLLALGTAILGSPWYIRNFIFYGHPTERITKNINGSFQWLEWRTLWPNIQEFFYKCLDNANMFTSDVPKVSGYGLLFFSLSIPFLIFNIFAQRYEKSSEFKKSFVVICVLFLIEFLIMTPYVTNQTLYNFRYFSWFSIFPIFMLAFAFSFSKTTRYAGVPILILSAFVSLFSTVSGGALSAENFPLLSKVPLLQRSSSDIADYTPREHHYYVHHLRHLGKIATQIGPDEYVYTLYGSDMKSNVVYCEKAENLEALKLCMMNGHAQFLYISDHRTKLLEPVKSSDEFLPILGNLFLLKRTHEPI